MCPVCWAALVAQVAFFATLGVVLVLLTDLKFGLPLSLGTLAIAAGNLWAEWSVSSLVLIGLGAALLCRATYVLRYHESNWVRLRAFRIGRWIKRKLGPLVYGS